MRDCDVLICGAGISGLLLAAELSKQLAVIVVDRNPRSACSMKFWLTTKQSLEPNPELEPYVDSEWYELDFIASSRAKFTAAGEYILWDTNRLETYLIETITANGGIVRYGHRFYGHHYAHGGIVSHINSETYHSSLLVDCMGFASPIVKASRAVNILGYHHLYGKVLRLKKEITPVAADNVLLSDHLSFFEVFPRSDGNANAVLIAPAETIRSTRTLGQDFSFIVEKSHYSDVLEPLPGGEILQGVVPVGTVRATALNRILFFGEAGQLHPAASGTCLTHLLLQYKSVAETITQKVRAGALSASDLSSVTRRMSNFGVRFHQNMFLEVIRQTSNCGDAFVELLNCLDQKLVNDFLFGDISARRFMRVWKLARLLQQRNFVWARPLLRTVLS
jgi:flavin-dependent dehydrogenase